MSAAVITEGAALFARYADAPNALGYCGPAGGDRHDRGRDPGVGAPVLRGVALPAGARPAHRHGRPARRPAGRGVLAGPRPRRRPRGVRPGAARRARAAGGRLLDAPDGRPARRGRPRPRLPRVRRLPVVAAAVRGPAAAVRARLLPHPVGHGGRPRPAHRLLAPADLGRVGARSGRARPTARSRATGWRSATWWPCTGTASSTCSRRTRPRCSPRARRHGWRPTNARLWSPPPGP